MRRSTRPPHKPQAERDAREARQALTFQTSPAAVAAGQVLNLRTRADPAALQAKFRSLDAYVWPMGPAGVSFSAELYGHLRAFYNHKDWGYKVDPAKGFALCAGSGGARLPYSHGRHDAEKRKLVASIQWDFVGTASTALQHLQPVELLERRFASSAPGGAGPSNSKGEGEELCSEEQCHQGPPGKQLRLAGRPRLPGRLVLLRSPDRPVAAAGKWSAAQLPRQPTRPWVSLPALRT